MHQSECTPLCCSALRQAVIWEQAVLPFLLRILMFPYHFLGSTGQVPRRIQRVHTLLSPMVQIQYATCCAMCGAVRAVAVRCAVCSVRPAACGVRCVCALCAICRTPCPLLITNIKRLASLVLTHQYSALQALHCMFTKRTADMRTPDGR
jgi:hypothetical protein